MQNAAPIHPSGDTLAAFALGKLPPEEASEIEGHLEGCTECVLVVQNTPADNFIRQVRAARSLDTSALPPRASGAATTPLPPSAAGLQLHAASGPTSAPGSVTVPAELVDHSRYRIQALLGKGGMGAVYKAEHRLMERRVALKIIGHDLSTRPELVERFRREVKAAARLSHPNIVTAFDAEQAGATHFLVMEYIEGTDLARLVGERGPLPVAEACGYVRQAALGLQHAHEQGMIHRDIKPHNLMLTPAGQVKILDFGLARLVQEAREQPGGVTALGVVMGTPDYMAPEQATDSHRADIRADIYSLGCTLYHLLSGRVPFPHDSTLGKVVRHATEQPTPLGGLRPELPPGLVGVVEKMMAKKPEARYQTPAEMAQALAPFAEGAAQAAEFVQVAKGGGAMSRGTIRRVWHQRRSRIGAGVLAVALLIAVVALLMHSWGQDRGPVQYLSDMQEFDVHVLVDGKPPKPRFAKNGDLGYEAAHYTRVFVAGNEFPHALSMHPPARGVASVKYRLEGRAIRFRAHVALNDSATADDAKPDTPLTFLVFGDGRELWTSKPVSTTGRSEECKIDVAGVRVLELRIDCPGVNNNAHAVWLEPRVVWKE
jgi:hypothetical protein